MLFDPRDLPARDIYRLLISVVIPRPIALVSTVGTGGVFNVAPFSYFNAIASEPPLIGVSISDRAQDPKDTLTNIRTSKDFVVNVVSEPILEPTVQAAGEWPAAVSEFGVSGLTARPAKRVTAPAVAESPIQLECVLHREIPLGNSFLVVGEVVLLDVRDDVLVEGQVDAARLAAVGRLGGEFYSLMRNVVKVPRPRVDRTGGRVS